MTGVTELAYIGIEALDLAAWENFAVELMGMQLADRKDEALRLRMDEKAYRWIITRGPADDLAFTGFECGSEADLRALVERLRNTGMEVAEGDAALASARRVGRIFVTHDPAGNRVELVTGLADADTPFVSGKLVSKFVTGDGGAGHEVLMQGAVDQQRMLDWYGLLGFKLSDTIEQELAPGMIAKVAFTHCNSRHHSVAIANMPFPKRIHHFMIEVADMSDVGFAFDRCMDAKRPFEMTLGMHPNDRMFSFYVRTPSGFNVEFGWGGLVIDVASWKAKRFDQLSVWGHRPPEVVAKLLA